MCYRENMQVEELSIELPRELEILFFRIEMADKQSILLCAMYRPQWQGSRPIEYLTNHLDEISERYNCHNTIIVGDLNQHQVKQAFNELTVVHGLNNFVDFQTHILGGSLDPVLSDLNNELVKCQPLDRVGTSDHMAVMSQVSLTPSRDESGQRKIWFWDHANWTAIKEDLSQIEWTTTLTGDVDNDVKKLTNHILRLQHTHVPHRTYSIRPEDQPWFGYRCRVAADLKYKAWARFKKHSTQRNKNLDRIACKNMNKTVEWATVKWKVTLKNKLRGNAIGSKQWWSLVKDQQGNTKQNRIPVLKKPDGTKATCGQEKAELLASHFSNKMKIDEPNRPLPVLLQRCTSSIDNIDINMERICRLLKSTNTKKATGPDDVSPHFLKHCAQQLSAPFTHIFRSCLSTGKWPDIWKEARVTPVHKKKSKSEPSNYRPISLLSCASKIFEQVIGEQLNSFLEDHHILSHRQYGFRMKRSSSDLLLHLSKMWNNSLDSGMPTLVIALDIAGAFDCVWHQALLSKLKAIGVGGDLLNMLANYT